MADSVMMNPRTAAKLDNYLSNPSQALLLYGPAGSGKLEVARFVASKLLEKPLDKLEAYAHFWIVELPEDKKNIPVEAIRELTKNLMLQVPGRQNVRRVVVIKDAHLMNHQAQNAFLKSLEEPAPGTLFILTADSRSSLLPTIASRTAAVSVDPVDLPTALRHFKDYSEKDIKTAWALSQGAAGLLASLLQDDNNQLKTSVEQAKAFITKPAYERILLLDPMKKDELSGFLTGLSKVLKALYRASAERQDNKRTKTLIKAFSIVTEVQQGLEANVMPRLLVLRLVLSLPL